MGAAKSSLKRPAVHVPKAVRHPAVGVAKEGKDADALVRSHLASFQDAVHSEAHPPGPSQFATRPSDALLSIVSSRSQRTQGALDVHQLLALLSPSSEAQVPAALHPSPIDLSLLRSLYGTPSFPESPVSPSQDSREDLDQDTQQQVRWGSSSS